MKTRALVSALLFGLALPVTAAPSLVALEDFPVAGEAMELLLQDEGQPATGLTVTAVYRENAHASIRKEQVVGTTDADGRVAWTPEAAGVVVLRWEGGSKNVSVLHDGAPSSAVLIAVLAGLALLGGSVLFFLQMLKQPDAELIEELEEYGEPPST